MSTDDTQPAQPPARRPREQQDQQTPPTVQVPAAKPEPPQDATRPVRAFQPPPPPPPPPGGGAGTPRTPAGGGQQPPPRAPERTVQDRTPDRTIADPTPPAYQPGGQSAGQPGGWQQPGQPGGWQQPGQQYEATKQWTPTAQPGQWQQGQPAGQGQAPYGGQAQPPASQPPAGQPGGRQRRPRRRRMRRSVMAGFIVVVLLILLVIADRVACAVAENQFASQMVAKGLPVKPSVNIEGFPFLNQLLSKDFKKVDISASNVPAGPVTISTVHATIDGLHISSLSSNASARVDHLDATAFVSFGSILGGAGIGDATGVTATQDGPDKIKITAGLGGLASDTEELQISQSGPQTISIKLLDNGGALGSIGSILGSASSFSFNLPKGVPASLRITHLTLNSQGLTVSAAASNAVLSQ